MCVGSHRIKCTLPYIYTCICASFFFGTNYVPGIFMPCVCVMHCRRRFFFRKNCVPGIFMPCVCVMSRRFFSEKKRLRQCFTHTQGIKIPGTSLFLKKKRLRQCITLTQGIKMPGTSLFLQKKAPAAVHHIHTQGIKIPDRAADVM